MKKYNLFGFFIVLIGAVLLLNALGVWAPPAGVSVWSLVWPAVIFGIGISHMVSNRRLSFWGICTTFFGAYFLLANLNIIPALSSAVIFPIILIFIGLSIFLPGGFRFQHHQKNVVLNTSSEGFVISNVAFGSDNRIIAGKEFSGAKIQTAFGESDLNLTGFETCSNPCNVSVSVAFGSCNLYLPPHAVAKTDALVCTFGGVEHRGIAMSDALYTIDISGSVTFGELNLIYPTVVNR